MDKYLRLFAKLRTDMSPARWSDETKHRDPHKPLLLLAALDLFEQGEVKTNLIELSPALGELFSLYWARVIPPDQKGNIAAPFCHLRRDKFWHLIARPGQETALAAARQSRSASQLREMAIGASLDETLYHLLQTKEARNILRLVLVETYFATKMQLVLVDQAKINREAYQYSQSLLAQARSRPAKSATTMEAYQTAVRDQGFRRAVATVYQHRCAFSGLRMVTADGHTAVEAAHIVPWSVSHNDDPRNGLALSKLHHWAFEEGLLGVSAKYEILVSPQLNLAPNSAGELLALAGKPLFLPDDPVFHPDPEALSWHRQERFRRR
jgi:putative restriction endonuclease